MNHKKVIIISLMLLSVFLLQAQQVSGYIEGGIALNPSWVEKIDENYYLEKLGQVFYLDLGVYLELKKKETGVKIGGSCNTYMLETNSIINYYPIYSSYTILTELFWRKWSIGFEHNCSHETVGWNWVGQVLNFNSSYDKVFIRFKF